MEYNYPIKYTIMPVFREGTSFNKVVPEGYIVTKCFKIGETTKHYPKGDLEIRYEIVYPYQQDRIESGREKFYFSTFSRVNPDINYVLNRCDNSVSVTQVYDTYDEALEHLNKVKNSFLGRAENPTKTREFWDACKDLETKIESNLSYLTLDYCPKKNSLVWYNGDKYQILEDSYIYSYAYDRFPGSMRTYTVGKEDYEKMKYKILNKIPITEEDRANAELLLLGTNKYNGVRLFIDNIKHTFKENYGCLMIYEKRFEYAATMACIPKHVDDEKPMEYFTTETAEDIIRSYIDRYIPDEHSIDTVTRIAGNKVLELKLPTK